MAKRLTEEAVDILETYLQEDEMISDLYENDVIDEEDILRLHEALSVVEEWDELLNEGKVGDATRSVGRGVRHVGRGTKSIVGGLWRGEIGDPNEYPTAKKYVGKGMVGGVPAMAGYAGYRGYKKLRNRKGSKQVARKRGPGRPRKS